MMWLLKNLGILGFGMIIGSKAYAERIVYPNFEHKDWQIVCDNTRTCRAAGYSSDDAKNRVTVLLTRKAGIGQDITAQVEFADVFDDDDKTVEDPSKMILKIDQKSYGKIGSTSGKDINDKSSFFLTPSQTQALLQALKGTSKIAFVGGDQEWVLSGDGAAAVLLKMDDVQGRVGTVSALIKKGTKPEDSILPALPMPVVYKKQLPKENPILWQAKIDWDLLKKELPSGKKFDDDNYCENLTEEDNEYKKFDPKVVAVLSQQRLLISGLCWRAAYNEGYGYWIINQQQPYRPKLITTLADSMVQGDAENNQMTSTMKGRGLGDCLSHMTWTWDGKDFVKTYDGDSGMCRMIMLGGAWKLPSYMAMVK